MRRRAGGIRLLVIMAAALLVASCTGGAGKSAGGSYHGPPVKGPANLVGVHFAWANLAGEAHLVKDLSGGSTFDIVTWCSVETSPGQFDWRSLDRAVDSANQLGIKVFLKLETGSCWATGEPAAQGGSRTRGITHMPSSMDAWAGFVRAVVKRYAPLGVREYAVGNEVNVANHFNGGVSQYRQLVEATARAIKASDPGAEVLDGGISSTGWGAALVADLESRGMSSQALSTYQAYFAYRISSGQFPAVRSSTQLSSVMRSSVMQRDIAFAKLTLSLASSGVISALQLHYYEPSSELLALLAFLRAHLPSGFPIQAWEVGEYLPPGVNLSDPLLAEDAVKLASLLLGSGVSPVIWLPLEFQGNRSRESNYALLDPQGAPRPIWAAWLRIASVTAGADRTTGLYDEGGVIGLKAAAGGRSSLLVWSTSGTRLLHFSPELRVTAPDGGPIASTGGKLELGGSPVLLSGPESAGGALQVVS
jgi:hypothetical protein